jgi:hypothetical protein
VDTSQFRGASPDTRLLIGIGVAVAVSAVAVLTVPNLRAKVVPGMRGALSALWIVARDRRKRVELFGGNVVSELLYALALGAACLAYGADLNLAQLVFVNTSASVLSSLIPVPGGIGAAEAAPRPGSSRWGSTSRPLSQSRSLSVSAPSTCRPSGATHRCGGSVARATCELGSGGDAVSCLLAFAAPVKGLGCRFRTGGS